MKTIVQVRAADADALHLSPEATNSLRTLAVAAGSNPGKPIDEAFRQFEARKAKLRSQADAL
jgi:hypothetical protein